MHLAERGGPPQAAVGLSQYLYNNTQSYSPIMRIDTPIGNTLMCEWGVLNIHYYL
jgi:hypothetical protein